MFCTLPVAFALAAAPLGQEGKALRWFLKRLEDSAPIRAALGIR